MNIAIILNYNDFDNTYNFVNSIIDYKSIDKIIVVDNNSPDNSFEALTELASEKVDVIKNSKNNGYSGGNNYGIKYAECKYNPKNIIISNPDIAVSDSSIINLIGELNKNEKLAIVTGVIHDINDNVVSNFGWRVPNYSDLLTSCFYILYKFRRVFLKNSIYYDKNEIINNKILKVEVVPGCFFIIKDEVIRKINYLDEDVFLFFEENILGKKLKDMGYKTCILCNEKIKHFNSVSIDKNISNWKRKENILRDSAIVYMKKYLKVNKNKINIYKLLFSIGKYEKRMITKIRSKND